MMSWLTADLSEVVVEAPAVISSGIVRRVGTSRGDLNFHNSDCLFETRQNEHVWHGVWAGIFWLHFCTVGGRGDTSSIFIYSLCDKPKFWTNRNFDLMVALSEKWRAHQSEYNSCWMGHERLTVNSCWDISLKTTNVSLPVALEEKSGDHQSH